MTETLTLTTPVSVTGYRVIKLALDWPGARIGIVVIDPGGVRTELSYDGAIATTLMNQLNTLDMSLLSLHKRILNRLAADGKLPPGTVTGTPD